MSSNVQNSGRGPGVSFLTESLSFDDLGQINDVLAALFVDLRKASQRYKNKDFSDRNATLIALGAASRFLMQFRAALDEQLHLPLMNLSSALIALSNNDVAPILKPTLTAAPKGGRALAAADRQWLIGVAVGTVGRLRWTGLRDREAQKVVAATLVRLGITPARGTGQITARTVKEWCDRVSASRPAIGAVLAGGREALAQAQSAVVAQADAVTNADMMLTTKWRLLIEGQPRDAARVFVLNSLRAAIQAKVVSGNTPRPGEKPVNPPS